MKMNSKTAAKADTYRLQRTTTPERLEMNLMHNSGTILTFGDRILVAGYYYNPNGRCYYGATYRFTTADLTCEGRWSWSASPRTPSRTMATPLPGRWRTEGVPDDDQTEKGDHQENRIHLDRDGDGRDDGVRPASTRLRGQEQEIYSLQEELAPLQHYASVEEMLYDTRGYENSNGDLPW